MRQQANPREAVLALLDQRGVSAKWLQKAAGLTTDTLNAEILDGTRRMSFLTTAMVSDALEVNLLDLVYESGELPVKLSEMARRLNASPEKVYRMAQRGEIPAFKVGRQWRFFPSKVIASLEAVAA